MSFSSPNHPHHHANVQAPQPPRRRDPFGSDSDSDSNHAGNSSRRHISAPLDISKLDNMTDSKTTTVTTTTQAEVGEQPDQSTSSTSNSTTTSKMSQPPTYVPASHDTPIPAHLAPVALYVALTAASLGILIGLTLPGAIRMLHPLHLSQISNSVGHRDWIGAVLGREAARGKGVVEAAKAFQTSSLTSQALRLSSSILPSSTSDSNSNPLLSPLDQTWSKISPFLVGFSHPQLHLYLLSVATFHILEFVVTARYNASRLLTDSFIIWNGTMYHFAHLTALLEFLVEAYTMPRYKGVGALSYAGILLVLFGQTLRSLAMVHAGNSFSHAVAVSKRPDHVLVTDGVYSFSRHPSYVGFFWWAMGTQLLLSNPISIVTFFALLWSFFSDRIRVEEIYLTNFFGQAYRDYKSRVGTRLPFIA